MKHYTKSILILSFLLLFTANQSLAAAKKSKETKTSAPQPTQLDKTIGDLAEVIAYNPIPVKGVGLVVGLAGTGSSECPPQMRDYLRQYILTQIGRKDVVNPDMMINSLDTAVVIVEGLISPAASKGDTFDISVKALANTQTTSLAGGRIYTSDLKFVTRIEDSLGASRTLARAAGPLFMDTIAKPKSDPRAAIVIGGGKVLQDYQVTLALYKPDFKAAAAIRNRINQRFGRDVANASSESVINITIPQAYKDKKTRFIELVKSLYIASIPSHENARISQLIESLQTEKDKLKYQTALESIGRPAVERLSPLLDSKDDQLRFIAAKCLLAVNDDRGLKVLRDFAQNNVSSSYRIDAIKAVGDYASKDEVIALMSRLVRDENIDVRYNAYTYLKKYNDMSVIRTAVSEDFYIDQVICTGPKTIYVTRTQQPTVVLFSAPINCEKNIYVESDDGSVILNSEPTDAHLSIMRKHPVTGELMGPLGCTTRVADMVKVLGDQPQPPDDKTRPGLGVPYSDIIILLNKLVEKGAVKADFIPGPSSPFLTK